MKISKAFLGSILLVGAASIGIAPLASADEGYFARQGFNTNSIGGPDSDDLTLKEYIERMNVVSDETKKKKKSKRDVSSDSFLDENYFYRSSPAN